MWLSEAEFGVNALGFLSQHLVVLLDPATIVENLHHAYHERGFFEARYAVLMTANAARVPVMTGLPKTKRAHDRYNGWRTSA